MRVKRGIKRHRKHKKILKATKGYRLTKSKLYRVAHEAYLHAGNYAFAGRKLRKRDFRRLWIQRLNAALRGQGLTYSKFIPMLNQANIKLNRKTLANIATHDPQTFSHILEKVKNNAKK